MGDINKALNSNKDATRSQTRNLVGYLRLNMLERLTGSGRQMFQGNNLQIQKSNGLNTVPLDQSWDSILIFQQYGGVSWVQGLRHGVAMHPKGGHLKEGMILPCTWVSQRWPVNNNHHYNHQLTHNWKLRTNEWRCARKTRQRTSIKNSYLLVGQEHCITTDDYFDPQGGYVKN